MLLLNKTLWKMAKELWGWIAVIAALKFVVLIGTAAFAKVISGFLGDFGSPALTPGLAIRAAFAAFLTAVVILAAELLTGEAESRCGAKARQSLRTQIFSKVLDLDVGNIEKIGAVSAITSSASGVEAMQIYYGQYLPGLLYSIAAPIYLFFQIREASLPSAALLFVVSFFLLPVNNIFRKHIERLKTQYWESLEDLTGYYMESVQGLTTFKLYRQDGERRAVLEEKSKSFGDKTMDMMRVNFLSFLLTDGLIYGAVTGSLFIAARQIAAGSLDFSGGVMTLMLSFSFFGSVRQLMNVTHTALAGVAAAERVSELLSIESERPYNPALSVERTPYDGIRMENVSFSYEGREHTLTDISLDIARGRVTALAGLSGCGKSTTASLLMRFMDVNKGRILLNGKEYTSFLPEELRKQVIIVPQTVSLFSGTVADNLRIAAPDASDKELLDALGEVRLSKWIEESPKGLLTEVGDAGGRLSGGQKQKIGIARALLCRAEYIIFDEATSSVDRESEEEIWDCIRRLAKLRTLIIISHRLSTIAQADCIYVLSGGRLVQRGTHSALMAEGGLYKELVDEQARLEGRREDLENVGKA